MGTDTRRVFQQRGVKMENFGVSVLLIVGVWSMGASLKHPGRYGFILSVVSGASLSWFVNIVH